MNKSIQISILVVLSLIWSAQVAFMPIGLSVLFFMNIVGLGIYYRKFNQHESFNFPKVLFKIPKLLFALFALIIIYIDARTFLGVEAGTAVLSTFLYAKALETKTKRDYIILFNFALFVSASLFLHSQAFWMAILVLCCLISCLVGLYRVQIADFELQKSVLKSLKTDSLHIVKFIGLALPFFLLLFMFFPRLPPLWQIPIPKNQSVTGLSDTMSPGDIAELSQSSALAFRVMGDMKNLPNRNELYWRAMVLDQYDGTTWTSDLRNKQPKNYANIKGHIDGFRYQYLPSDPTQQWITGLETSVPVEQRFQLNQDWSIKPKRLVQRTQPIELQWIGNNITDQTDAQISKQSLNQNLKFPQKSDPKAQMFAHDLYRQSSNKPDLYIQNLLNWYQKEKFVYTLTPGRLGKNRVDEFLFQSKQGFCEHYASSFVMLMRYVGIPARVVTGYQGGELAPDAKSWEVRQLDAHAWTEVYLQGKWHRIDPTAMIAPARIDQGMQNILNGDSAIFGDGAYSSLRLQNSSLLRSLRVWSDYANFQWQSKVVGYDAEKQNSWMKKLGLTSNYSYGLVLIFGVLGLLLMYWGITKFYIRQQLSDIEKVLLDFSRQLDVNDRRVASETFQQWMRRLSLKTEHMSSFEQANLLFQKLTYLADKNQQDIQKFKILLKDCANELKQRK